MNRRFVMKADVPVEPSPWGPHEWHCRPGLVEAHGLLVVTVTLPPGKAHQFHRHPKMEEVIHILEGRAEQWVDRESRMLGPGESAHIPVNLVHGIYNVTDKPCRFMAALSGSCEGPVSVDCCLEEPWSSIKKPVNYA